MKARSCGGLKEAYLYATSPHMFQGSQQASFIRVRDKVAPQLLPVALRAAARGCLGSLQLWMRLPSWAIHPGIDPLSCFTGPVLPLWRQPAFTHACS